MIVQKIDLIQRYRVNFPNFQIIRSPKNLNLTLLKLYTQVLLVGVFAVYANGFLLCFSRNKSFLEILSSGEYKKRFFLKTLFVRGSSIVRLVLVFSHHATLLKPSRRFLRFARSVRLLIECARNL